MSDKNLLTYGTSLDEANAAVILLHGRGATADDLLPLAQEWAAPGVAFLLPQAPGFRWYPYSFLAPLEANQPDLGNALAMVEGLLADLQAAGIAAERVVLGGFSQGACLALEFAASHAQRYGGLAGLSGGLIGPPGTSRAYAGLFAGTPVFLGCSDVDPHIPKDRVIESKEVFERMGAVVDARLYPGMGHFVNDEEIAIVKQMIADLNGNLIARGG